MNSGSKHYLPLYQSCLQFEFLLLVSFLLEKLRCLFFYIGKFKVPLDGISTLSKALCCWVSGLVFTSEL
jgi:hypothetical protein